MPTAPDNHVLYAKCECGSGEKYKFCCFKKDKNIAKETKGELDSFMSRSLGILNYKLNQKRQLAMDNELHIEAVKEALAGYEKEKKEKSDEKSE